MGQLGDVQVCKRGLSDVSQHSVTEATVKLNEMIKISGVRGEVKCFNKP